MFAGKASSQLWIEFPETCRHQTGLERLADDKHSSLFGTIVSYEDESFIRFARGIGLAADDEDVGVAQAENWKTDSQYNQLTGGALGWVFNFRSSCMHTMHFMSSAAIQSNLEFEPRPKQLLGSLPLVITLP